ncbi:MAG TPA: hypothetical protein VGB92_25890 [Longimicrobium sp.]
MADPNRQNDVLYTYHGPLSGVTLIEGEGAGRTEREVMLSPDSDPVPLPPGHPHVQTLVALQLLREAAPTPAPPAELKPPTSRRSSTASTTSSPEAS